jgi:hypothetical protein
VSLNRWLGAWALGWVLFSVLPAAAQKRVVVMNFDGPQAAAVRAQVVGALSAESEVEVVSVKDVNAAADRLGVSTNNADDLTKVAAELGVSAFIEGDVSKEGKNFRALTRVRNAATGDVVHEEPWVRNKKTIKTIRAKFWGVMKPHILATEAPAKPEEPEPEPEEPEPVAASDDEEPEDDEEEPEDEGPTGESLTHPALVAYLGPKFMWRSLSYGGPTGLSSYKNEAASPGVSAALGILYFPGAHVTAGIASNFGLQVDFEYTLGLTSKQGTEELKTTAFEFDVQGVFRYPIGDFEPRVRVGYLKHTFEVEKSALLPPVSYSGVPMSLGVVANLVESLSIDVDLGYIIVLDPGGLATPAYADNASAGAFDASAGLTYRFAGPFGARLGVDFRRYFLDFGSSTNTAIALPDSGDDDYFRLLLAFVYTMAGKQ